MSEIEGFVRWYSSRERALSSDELDDNGDARRSLEWIAHAVLARRGQTVPPVVPQDEWWPLLWHDIESEPLADAPFRARAIILQALCALRRKTGLRGMARVRSLWRRAPGAASGVGWRRAWVSQGALLRARLLHDGQIEPPGSDEERESKTHQGAQKVLFTVYRHRHAIRRWAVERSCYEEALANVGTEILNAARMSGTRIYGSGFGGDWPAPDQIKVTQLLQDCSLRPKGNVVKSHVANDPWEFFECFVLRPDAEALVEALAPSQALAERMSYASAILWMYTGEDACIDAAELPAEISARQPTLRQIAEQCISRSREALGDACARGKIAAFTASGVRLPITAFSPANSIAWETLSFVSSDLRAAMPSVGESPIRRPDCPLLADLFASIDKTAHWKEPKRPSLAAEDKFRHANKTAWLCERLGGNFGVRWKSAPEYRSFASEIAALNGCEASEAELTVEGKILRQLHVGMNPNGQRPKKKQGQGPKKTVVTSAR